MVGFREALSRTEFVGRDLKNDWVLGRERVGHKKVPGRRNNMWEDPDSGRMKASLRGE